MRRAFLLGEGRFDALDEEALEQHLASPATSDECVWIDLDASAPAEERKLAARLFAPNEAVLSAFVSDRHPPRFDTLADGAFLMLRGLDAETRSHDFGTIQIAMLVRPGLIVTRHTGDSVSIEQVLRELGAGRKAPRDAWGIALEVSTIVIGRFLPIVLDVEQRLEELEDELFERPSDDVLTELTAFRTSLKRMRRVTAYHSTLFGRLLESETPGLDKVRRRTAKECGHALERLATLQQLFHDLCGDLIDGHLALAAHRLNEIMRVLTIVTAIFVPLGFLAGVYGMNFSHIPELGWRWGYFALLGVMGTIAGSLLLIFRRKRWL